MCLWDVHQCMYTWGGQRTTLTLIPWVPSLLSFLFSFLIAGTQHLDYPDLHNALDTMVSSRLSHMHPMSCFLTHDLSLHHVKNCSWTLFPRYCPRKMR